MGTSKGLSTGVAESEVTVPSRSLGLCYLLAMQSRTSIIA